jgi:hypothetical protein
MTTPCGLFGQGFDFGCDHREATARLYGARRLERGVEAAETVSPLSGEVPERCPVSKAQIDCRS